MGVATEFWLNMSHPTLEDFVEALSTESEWYTLCVFLGAPTHELDDINRNYRYDGIKRCLIEVYKCLENAQRVPTWQSIEFALRRTGNIALANKIKTEYIDSPRASSSAKNEGKLISCSVNTT